PRVCTRIVAEPHMGVLLWPNPLIFLADLLQNGRKPRIVLIVNLDDFTIYRRVNSKSLIGRRCSSFRVPGNPDLGPFFANSRDSLLPSDLGDRFGFINPKEPNSCRGLDALDISSKSDKSEINTSVFSPDVLFPNLVILRQPRLTLNCLLNLRHAAFIKRVLKLSTTNNNPALLRLGASETIYGSHLGKTSTFGTTPTTIGTTVQGFT